MSGAEREVAVIEQRYTPIFQKHQEQFLKNSLLSADMLQILRIVSGTVVVSWWKTCWCE